MTKFIRNDPKLLSAGIIGYTGETGKALSREILKNDIFKSTTLIGRRNVEYKEDFYKNAKQVIIDYNKLDEYEDAFKHDVIYCCLGTTRGKSGVDGFRKVDFDYVVNSAKAAKKNGCKQFHLVSSSGANHNSSMLYPQVKGQSEEAIKELDFDHLFIYRPKVLMVDREESRAGERLLRFLIKPVAFAAPQLITTPIETLANSLIARAIYSQESDKQIELLDNRQIFAMSDLYKNPTKE